MKKFKALIRVAFRIRIAYAECGIDPRDNNGVPGWKRCLWKLDEAWIELWPLPMPRWMRNRVFDWATTNRDLYWLLIQSRGIRLPLACGRWLEPTP